MRDLLATRRSLVDLLGGLEPNDAAMLLRGLAAELAPLGITDCSGWHAPWCQVHGVCSCREQHIMLGDLGCPLHDPDSAHDASHAPRATAPEVYRG